MRLKLQIPIGPIHQPKLQGNPQEQDPLRNPGTRFFTGKHIKMDQ